MVPALHGQVKQLQLSTVEVVLLVFLLLFGIPMIVLIPPGAGYDEEDHLVRVWELSAWSFIPGQLSPQEMKYPMLFRDFAYRQQGSTGVLGEEFWERYGRASFYEYGFVHREINTKSVYSPALLLPQALTLHVLGRRLDLPALPVFYASRFASLLSYVLLVWLAIRWIPYGKWILLVLAATPMALFQAATISPDAISNGIGFLFIAGCLRTAELKEIDWKEFGRLVVLVGLLFLAKLNLIPLILLPFLLIPPARFPKKGMYVLLLVATVALFLAEMAGWYLIAWGRSDPLMANDANPMAQLRYVAGHPLAFLGLAVQDFLTNGWMYFESWINGYGYYYWTPPLVVLLLFLLAFAAVLLLNSTHEQVGWKSRTIFLFVFLMGYLATLGALYTTFTPVGLDQILGVQGRYFTPLALFPFLVVSSLPWTRKVTITSPRWVIIFLAGALSLNLAGLFLSFHVPCGSTFYQTGLCYRPLFKEYPNGTHASQPVSSGLALAQEIRVACDGFAEVRVLTLPAAKTGVASTRFILRDALNDQVLLDTSVANDRIDAEDWYPLQFPPVWRSAGKQYVLEISSARTDGGQGLRLLYTPQSVFDLGTLFENGEPVQEDLVLQYGCATGLRKNWPSDQATKP